MEKVRIHEITQLATWGFGATITVRGLGTIKGAATVTRILKGVRAGLSGVGLKIAAAEVKVIATAVKAGRVGAEVVTQGGKATVRGGARTFRVLRGAKLVSKILFLDRILAVALGLRAAKKEEEEGGDISQIIAAGLVTGVGAFTFVDLVLPEGVDPVRAGSLIIPGGVEGFVTKRSFVAVVGEAFRLLVFG